MDGINPALVHSFAQHRGARGVHFYDSSRCEFLDWSEALAAVEANFPETFATKLVDAMANYDPASEFVSVSAGGGQLTIELFRAEELG